MSYNPDNQYRCTIIRGKSQTEMEDLLPYYAQTVHNNCPCSKNDFDERCNKQLSKYIFGNDNYEDLPSANQKTIRNHITEIMGKLLGLYYTTLDNIVYESESCKFLLSTNDFPAFFKNICVNFQFPNFAEKIQTLTERISKRIKIRPLCYVVAFLNYARSQKENKAITKQEIGYYILNNLDVLRGEVSVNEVYSRIMSDRKNNVHKPKLSGSHDWQHIKEQFNLLTLSNIVDEDSNFIWLNEKENNAINFFVKKNDEVLFDLYKYNLDSEEGKKLARAEWNYHYGMLNQEINNLDTKFDNADEPSIGEKPLTKERGAVGLTTVEIGDKGEAFVYKMECDRIRSYKERLVNKVILLGKTKGLGYDIKSIEANENPSKPEFDRYIEVKSTVRISEPSFDNQWTDSINLTSKEWIAAEQHREYYNIYRVYFTKSKTIVVKINNPFQKAENGEIEVYPTVYQMDFSSKSIKKQYEEQR